MAQTIKEKPTGGKPKVLSKAAQAPKELVKKGMLEAGRTDAGTAIHWRLTGKLCCGKGRAGNQNNREKGPSSGKKDSERGQKTSGEGTSQRARNRAKKEKGTDHQGPEK